MNECIMAMTAQQEVFRQRATAYRDLLENSRSADLEIMRYTYEEHLGNITAQAEDDASKYEMGMHNMQTQMVLLESKANSEFRSLLRSAQRGNSRQSSWSACV